MSVCLCVCLCVRFFLGHFETDWDALWHTVSFWPWAGSKTIIFQNKAITMMRGKSPRSDVEMSEKTKFRGGHLGFLAGISQSIMTRHVKFTSE